MELQALVGLAGAPVVAGLVNVFVKPWAKDPRIWPVSAVVLGMVWNLTLAAVLGQPFGVAVVLGLLSGLAASGAYSATRTMAAGG